MYGFNSGDTVIYTDDQGQHSGLIQDIRVKAPSAGTVVTFVVLLDGRREPVYVTDPTRLVKR